MCKQRVGLGCARGGFLHGRGGDSGSGFGSFFQSECSGCNLSPTTRVVKASFSMTRHASVQGMNDVVRPVGPIRGIARDPALQQQE